MSIGSITSITLILIKCEWQSERHWKFIWNRVPDAISNAPTSMYIPYEHINNTNNVSNLEEKREIKLPSFIWRVLYDGSMSRRLSFVGGDYKKLLHLHHNQRHHLQKKVGAYGAFFFFWFKKNMQMWTHVAINIHAYIRELWYVKPLDFL